MAHHAQLRIGSGLAIYFFDTPQVPPKTREGAGRDTVPSRVYDNI